MSAPVKPWETVNAALHGENLNTDRLGMSSGRNVLNSHPHQLSSHPVGSPRAVMLPPLPPRPPQLAMSGPSRSTLGMAPSMYGGYSGFGGYPSFGSYPGNMYLPGAYGYGTYRQPGNVLENRFLQAAEESSRNAFQSVESLVRAFTSVSMMLESTYHAMYSSFRAILGVVDNFSRLRQMFAQFLSAITILRIIKNFYRRLLYWLGVIDHNPQADRIWEAVSAGGTSNNQVATFSSWPLLTFIGLLFGGPYLISKFFSSNTLKPKTWDLNNGKLFKAAYPHEAASDAELSFIENEVLNVAPPEFQLQDGNGWVLAANRQGKVGYVPVTRLSAHSRQDIKLNQGSVSTQFNDIDTSSVPSKE